MKSRLVLCALVTLLVLAGCSAKSSGYPDAYLLTSDELPAGLKLSEVPEDMPIKGNPAEVPANLLQGIGEEFRDFAPEKVWIEMVENSTSSSEHGAMGGLIFAPLFWTDASKAQHALDEIRAQGDNDMCAKLESGAMLRDKNVIVVIAGDPAMSSWMPKIISALQKKSSGLEDIC